MPFGHPHETHADNCRDVIVLPKREPHQNAKKWGQITSRFGERSLFTVATFLEQFP